MFTGTETPSKHVMCRIQQNKSFGLGWVPLDAVTVMIILRDNTGDLNNFCCLRAGEETNGWEEGSRRMGC